MADEPAGVSVACAMCPDTFTPDQAQINLDAMATVVASTGDRVWFALCPSCSDFLRARS